MKRAIRWLVILGILGLICWGIGGPGAAYWKERSKITYRELAVTRGKIVAVVNSTGTIKPVLSVTVGAFVPGPIDRVLVDHNARVIKDEVLARIDPKIYEAQVARDRATLATQVAAVKRVKSNLQQAKNNERRAQALRTESKSFISDQEMDVFLYARMALEADLDVAETSVDQAKAALDQSLANLGYTTIKSPVDGIVIDRKIDPGQTVASQFQTPELFIVAPDMEKEMYVYASVDESDIGLIDAAQKADLPVRYTVDAWPDELFEGKIYQIRMNATTTQNVVTYPVIVSTPNPGLKLKPNMTASLSFHVKSTGEVLRIPNAALRFYPQRDQVRPEDRDILDNKTAVAGEADDGTAANRSADEKAELRRKRNRRHLWVIDGDYLRAIEVVVGLSSNQYTELVSGDLHEGDKLVTGIQPKQ